MQRYTENPGKGLRGPLRILGEYIADRSTLKAPLDLLWYANVGTHHTPLPGLKPTGVLLTCSAGSTIESG